MVLSATQRKELASQIADLALIRGEFTLRSGRTSSYYLDKYLFCTRPEVLGPLAGLFAETIARIERDTGTKADRLAGAELGGVPLVSATSLAMNKPCVFIRNQKKEYGTAKQLEGVLEPGDAVVLVEDVATTAGQALEACRVIEAAGATVLAVIVAIDRQEGAAETLAGYHFESLFTVADLGIDPEDRP